jgi:hypothetical protein
VPLTYPRFRAAFAGAVGEQEARDLYRTYAVPASDDPLSRVPRPPSRGPARADHRNPDRGHSLSVDGGWREVCGTALAFVRRFVATPSPG